MLFVKKIKKLFKNPKIFFKDYKNNKEIKLALSTKRKSSNYQSTHHFSIVSAVYNVEKYLPDFLNSIINQSLDFKKNIELILVDDGSNDLSAKIIKKYQEKYPKNIIYIYKKNGGQASARNLGLKEVSKEWISFIDPDDFINPTYFEYVDKAICENKNIAMIACSLVFFYEKDNSYKDTHPLNFKFKNKKTLKIKNLDNFIQLSASSAVFNTKAIKEFNFDEELKPNFEDAKFLNQYLLNNLEKDAVFLPDAKYFYRKRADESSTLDGKLNDKQYYLNVTKKGYLELLEYTKKQHQEVPDFIQQIVLYDIYWLLISTLNKNYYTNILNADEIAQTKETLFKIFKFIDIKNIQKCNYSSMWFFHKIAMLSYFKKTELDFNILYIKDIDYMHNKIIVSYFSNSLKNSLELVFSNGKNYKALNHKCIKYDFFGDVFIYEHFCYFKLTNATSFKAKTNTQQMMIGYKKYEFTLIKKQKIKDAWIFIDTDTRADDNAEHLYRYVMKNNLFSNIYFALNKDSKDWQRLKDEGFRLVDFKSKKFAKIAADASLLISSGADGYVLKHFTINSNHTKFVFLQHGVTQNDLSTWMNIKSIHLFTCTTKPEYDSIINGNYKFSEQETKLTGFARHDRLIELNKQIKDENTIILMPTWWHYLVQGQSDTALRKINNKFLESNYFKTYSNLLQNQELFRLLGSKKYKLKVFLHPAMSIYKDDFKTYENQNIIVENLSDISLQNELASAKALITDYSSIAFEMALLDKAVIYFQFDKDEFFANHTCKQGYFSYERDGFGDVVKNEENLLKSIKKLLKNDCLVEEKYQKRIDSTFTLRDGKNCKRIYQKIKQL